MQTHLADARQDMHTDAIPAATSLQTSLSLAAAILSRARASSAIPSATRLQARQWLTLAEQQLPILTADAILRLLSLYTPLHHIAYSVPPSPEFINKWHEHTLLLIAKGQKQTNSPSCDGCAAGLLTTREPCPRVYAHGMPTCSPAG